MTIKFFFYLYRKQCVFKMVDCIDYSDNQVKVTHFGLFVECMPNLVNYIVYDEFNHPTNRLCSKKTVLNTPGVKNDRVEGTARVNIHTPRICGRGGNHSLKSVSDETIGILVRVSKFLNSDLPPLISSHTIDYKIIAMECL